jgi:hypothetical protein
VIVNDSTDYRLDVMPFGGRNHSGVGREGSRFAIQEMTETRVVCFNVSLDVLQRREKKRNQEIIDRRKGEGENL